MSIYLDNAATTRVAPEAVAAMQRCLEQQYGNPSSSHSLGVAAARAVDKSRKTLARLLACKPEEIVFTSGGSEADNLAVLGTARASGRRKLVVSAVEHPAVLEPARELARQGYTLEVAPVDHTGTVVEDALLDMVDGDTFLVSVMHANNEVGTIQPVRRLAGLVKRKDPEVLFHTDAVQYFAKEPVDLSGGLIDLLSLAAHKIHGPKGVGALWVRSGTRIHPLVFGGGQERNLRAGTENVPGIVGLAAAAGFLHARMEEHRTRVGSMVSGMLRDLGERIPDMLVNGHPERRLPHMASIAIPGLKSQNLVGFLEERGVIVSAGSACHSQDERRSHVLDAMCLPAKYATLRISASLFNTAEEGARAVDVIASVVAHLRK